MGKKNPRPDYRPRTYSDFRSKSAYNTEQNSSPSNYSRRKRYASPESSERDWMEKNIKSHSTEPTQNWEKILDNIENPVEQAESLPEIKETKQIETVTEKMEPQNVESNDILNSEPDKESLEKFFKEVDEYLIEVSNTIKNDKTEEEQEKIEKLGH